MAISLKYEICQKVWYFNSSSEMVESDEIKGARVMATGISKDENGESVCDGYVVLYQLDEGLVLSEREVFASADECWGYYKEFFSKMRVGD